MNAGRIKILKIEELVDFSQFEDLEDVWNNILIKAHDNDVFSTWEWLSCWWKHFGDGRDLSIFLAKNGDGIFGIAPFMLSSYSFLGLGRLRKLEFIGSPQSDYNSLIIVKNGIECLKLFMDHLVTGCSDWDYLELTDVREDSLSADLLSTVHDDGPLELERVVTTLCPYINLPSSAEAFEKRLSQNMRRNLRKRMRQLRRDCKVRIKTYRDFGSVQEAMRIFFKLHQKRWRSKGQPGAFANKEICNFHFDVARIFAERGWLSLYFLTASDEPVAAVYSFDYGLKKYGYLTGFDPEYHSYGVGNLLKMCVVEDCIRRGLKEYDLGRDHEPYKADWATGLRKNFELRVVRGGWFAKIYGWATKNMVSAYLIKKFGASLSLGY